MLLDLSVHESHWGTNIWGGNWWGLKEYVYEWQWNTDNVLEQWRQPMSKVSHHNIWMTCQQLPKQPPSFNNNQILLEFCFCSYLMFLCIIHTLMEGVSIVWVLRHLITLLPRPGPADHRLGLHPHITPDSSFVLLLCLGWCWPSDKSSQSCCVQPLVQVITSML